MTSVQIIEYGDEHHRAFKELNVEWLDHYGLLEPRDMEALDDPRTRILDTGGIIYLAQCDNRIVGSAALLFEHDGVYELAKMAVAREYRGKGISKLLMEMCIKKANELKASKITLFSNSQLQVALTLYEKYGFRHVPVENSPFATADVKMELML
ncbi:MAG TPA: GNAT family N-acetyltransferase [Cyclobacteriaceae bacterium]|nr:GNAT family N-acetyltransferase [Cyclobacteriaceae bacterium]